MTTDELEPSMNDDLERLEPCPFCGSGDQLLVEHMEGTILHPAYRVRCDNCGASSGYTDRDHVGAWNVRSDRQRRAQAAEPVGKIGRVEIINGRVKSYGFEQPEIPDGNYALYAGPPPPKPPSGPAELLCGATRFKLSFSSRGNVSALANYRDLLDGRWVALVAAENDRHLRCAAPVEVTEEVRPDVMAWQPIETAPKYDGPIYVFSGGELKQAAWHRGYSSSTECCWCLVEYIVGHGIEHFPMSEQPKFWFNVVPPPIDEQQSEAALGGGDA